MLQAGCRFAVAVSCMDARQAALIRLFRRFPGLVGVYTRAVGLFATVAFSLPALPLKAYVPTLPSCLCDRPPVRLRACEQPAAGLSQSP